MFQKYLIEFIGSILFIYVVLITNNPLAIGATLTLILLLVSKFSSGHLNPAITIAGAVSGQFPIRDVLPYCLSQILGGLVAVQLFRNVKL